MCRACAEANPRSCGARTVGYAEDQHIDDELPEAGYEQENEEPCVARNRIQAQIGTVAPGGNTEQKYERTQDTPASVQATPRPSHQGAFSRTQARQQQHQGTDRDQQTLRHSASGPGIFSHYASVTRWAPGSTLAGHRCALAYTRAMRRDRPRRWNALEGGAGPGSGRTAQVVLQALAAGPQGAQMRAQRARTMAPQTTAEMVAPAAAYDRAVRNRWRGSIDARAVRARFSDPALHERLCPRGREEIG